MSVKLKGVPVKDEDELSSSLVSGTMLAHSCGCSVSAFSDPQKRRYEVELFCNPECSAFPSRQFAHAALRFLDPYLPPVAVASMSAIDIVFYLGSPFDRSQALTDG